MSAKEEFIEIFQEQVHREGAQALLDYLSNKKRLFHRPGLGPVPRVPTPAACASIA